MELGIIPAKLADLKKRDIKTTQLLIIKWGAVLSTVLRLTRNEKRLPVVLLIFCNMNL